MIWAEWRRRRHPEEPERADAPFEDVLEQCPLAALLLDRAQQVVAGNKAARAMFGFSPERLPMGLVEATREAVLVTAVTSGKPRMELRFAHRRRVVKTTAAPGPEPGETLLFVEDVTHLRRLETVRQEFVANLAHELKTPMTSMRLAVESLQVDLPPETRKKLAARAMDEVDHLSLVIANLRQLAELDAGRDVAKPEPFEVRTMVDETIDRLRLNRPVELDVPIAHIVADRSKISQALANLLENAAKFSSPGTAVEVTTRAEDGSLTVLVRDHGPGISPEHWDRVFERFYKVDASHSREVPGSGLGLSIVRNLAAALGGRAWTEAAAEGGQIFGISVPTPTPERGAGSEPEDTRALSDN